jgi:hypothetical protein
MEILTNPVYHGAHLRITDGVRGISSTVFNLRFLRTAMIAECDGIGPIVLGPVRGLVYIRNVKNTRISVVCSRIVIENCENITVYLNVSTTPILSYNCKEVMFAPYNVFYDVSLYLVEMNLTLALRHFHTSLPERAFS